MFEWFWTIFSLGAPDSTSTSKLTFTSQLAPLRWKRICVKLRRVDELKMSLQQDCNTFPHCKNLLNRPQTLKTVRVIKHARLWAGFYMVHIDALSLLKVLIVFNDDLNLKMFLNCSQITCLMLSFNIIRINCIPDQKMHWIEGITKYMYSVRSSKYNIVYLNIYCIPYDNFHS